jgi:hypothetical protein
MGGRRKLLYVCGALVVAAAAFTTQSTIAGHADVGPLGWQRYTPILDTTSGESPSVGANGALRGYYRDDGATVEVLITTVLGSDFRNANGFWRWSLPVKPDLDLEQTSGVPMVVGTVMVNDISDSTGFGTHAHRTGTVAITSGTKVVAAFDAFPAQQNGAVTVRANATTTLVNHQLGQVPTRVIVSATNAAGATGQPWVSNRTATSFTLNTRANTAVQTFDWVTMFNAVSYLTPTYPYPWAQGDRIRMFLTYPKAIETPPTTPETTVPETTMPATTVAETTLPEPTTSSTVP